MNTISSRPLWRYDTNWLSGPAFDNLLIFGVLFIAVLSGLIVWAKPELFGVVLFIDLWFLGYHHVIATFTKLAGTPQDRRENRFLIYYLPIIVVMCVLALAFGIGIWVITTIYFFWQWYHYTRQSYGISAFYRRKAQKYPEEPRWLEHVMIWSMPTWGILNRCVQDWDRFLFQEIWLPYIPPFVLAIAGLFMIMATLYWLVLRFIAFRNGRLPLGHTLFVLSHITTFYIGYILISEINTGWLVANIWHNAQYILFVWLYNTKRFSKPDENSKTVMAWVSQTQPVRIIAYFTGCILVTSVFYNSVEWGLNIIAYDDAILLGTLYIVTFQTINFHHYVVDSLIWKARKPVHQKVMGIKQQTDTPS
ncbi:MAG: hypothetical protein GC137_02945 [Alphaproteobacteria bacterium]|nr:hypothetical protein [Alphaproteobacteria bacterium]